MFQKQFEDFRKKVEEKVEKAKSIAIYYDSDADGCCSAALLTIYLLKKHKEYPLLVSCFHDVDKRLENSEEDLIFVLDTFAKTDKSNLIIIDHHVITNIPKSSLFFNPRLFDKDSYLATSYLVYKILDLPEDTCWIVSTGVKADKSEESCEDVLDLTYKKFPEFKDLEGRLIRLTSVAKNLPDANIVVNSLVECYNIGTPSFFGKTPSSSKLIKKAKLIRAETARAMLSLKKIFESDKILVCSITTEFNIQSLIAARLFMLNPEKTVVVCNLRNDIIHAEARTDSKHIHEKFFERLKDVVENIGGHECAFGFSFDKNKLKNFIQILTTI
jgi:single-stranded DNA-specific DHH superfamily exonuclease